MPNSIELNAAEARMLDAELKSRLKKVAKLEAKLKLVLTNISREDYINDYYLYLEIDNLLNDDVDINDKEYLKVKKLNDITLAQADQQYQERIREYQKKCKEIHANFEALINNHHYTMTISKKAQFFISVIHRDERNHSVVMLGTIQNGKPIFLASISKILKKHTGNLSFIFNALFSRNESVLSGAKLLNNSPSDCSYVSYDINYEQYRQFIQLISSMDRYNGDMYCFQPTALASRDKVIFRYKKVNKTPSPDSTNQSPLVQNVKEKTAYLNINNTCRHTAINLIELSINNELTENVSRSFFHDLPLRTTLVKGDIADHWYSFPLPPTSYGVTDKESLQILTIIYNRLFDVVKKDPYSDVTTQKFDALKQLYLEQAGILKTQDIAEALTNIKNWKTQSKTIISQIRNPGLLSRLFHLNFSSTVAMGNEVEQKLERLIKSRESAKEAPTIKK